MARGGKCGVGGADRARVGGLGLLFPEAPQALNPVECLPLPITFGKFDETGVVFSYRKGPDKPERTGGVFVKGFLRRLRGIFGTAIIWAFGWSGVSALLGLLIGLPNGIPLRLIGPIALSGSFLGFIAGGSFAVLLSVLERRRTLDQLSLWRVALWGGIGGMALLFLAAPRLVAAGIPLGQVLTSYLLPLAVNGLLGAGFAAGSVALARREDTRLIEGDDSALMLEGE